MDFNEGHGRLGRNELTEAVLLSSLCSSGPREQILKDPHCLAVKTDCCS